jgi:hypothetical protein
MGGSARGAKTRSEFVVAGSGGGNVMVECCTTKCSKLPTRDKRKVVWLVDGRPYCNVCFLNWIEDSGMGNERIVRLYEDEDLYADIRTQKRRRRVHEPNPCGAPMQMRA